MTRNCYKLIRKIASFRLNNPYSYNSTETFKYTSDPKSYAQSTYTQPKYNVSAQNTFDPNKYMPSTSSTIKFGAVGGNSEENKTYSKYQNQFGQWLWGKLFGKTKDTGTQTPPQQQQQQPETSQQTTQRQLSAARHETQLERESANTNYSDYRGNPVRSMIQQRMNAVYGADGKIYRAAPSKKEYDAVREKQIASWRAKPAGSLQPHQIEAIKAYDASNSTK